MSLPFSDTSTKKGIIQEIESECGFNDGDISGNATLLKKFTSSINLALDDFWAIAIPSSGKWQIDDSNQTDYPIVTTNIVSGQRDYSFTTDGTNLILDIYRVMVANSAGIFTEIRPVDQQSDLDVSSFYDGRNGSGAPYRYDKTGNGIFLDPVPNYNYTAGLKIFINREPAYFSSGDTTKKPGVPGIFHKYFVLKPSLDYYRRNDRVAYNRINDQVLLMEQSIRTYFAGRDRGMKRGMRANVENNK